MAKRILRYCTSSKRFAWHSYFTVNTFVMALPATDTANSTSCECTRLVWETIISILTSFTEWFREVYIQLLRSSIFYLNSKINFKIQKIYGTAWNRLNDSLVACTVLLRIKFMG